MWPESGHQPTTRAGAGAASARARSASTSATRASSARTDTRRGPDSTTRCATRVRTSARPRSAKSAECGLSHQWSRPTTNGSPRAGQSSAHHSRVAHVTASAATALRPASDSDATQRSSWETVRLPSRTPRSLYARRARTASCGVRASPPSRDRTAASPIVRRAVRADHANGPSSSAPHLHRHRYPHRLRRPHAHVVVRHPERPGTGAAHGQPGERRLRRATGVRASRRGRAGRGLRAAPPSPP